MTSTCRKIFRAASLAFAVSTTSAIALTQAPPAQAGPISEMIARHRQKQAMKLPPIDKPFTLKPVRDLNTPNLSLAQKFKTRFSLKRGASQDGGIPMNKDLGVMRTSH